MKIETSRSSQEVARNYPTKPLPWIGRKCGVHASASVLPNHQGLASRQAAFDVLPSLLKYVLLAGVSEIFFTAI